MLHEHRDEFPAFLHEGSLIPVDKYWSHDHLIETIKIFLATCVNLFLLFQSWVIWVEMIFIFTTLIVYLNIFFR